MRGLVVTVVALLAAGCVLFVEPLDLDAHCSTAGSGACATCVRKACQDQIDTCCGQPDCRGSTILGELDACGNENTGTCANALATTRIGKDEEALRSCASLQCKSECTRGSTPDGGIRQKWTCDTKRIPANACASCIYDQCNTAIGSCCSDSSCSSDDTIEYDMGACTSGDTSGCTYGYKARSTTGQAGRLRACIANNCSDTCFGEGIPHQRCQLLSGGSYCACRDDEIGGGDVCGTGTVGGGECVVGLKGCQCGHYSCNSTGTGSGYDCACGFTGSGQTGDTQTCTLPSDAVENATCCLAFDDESVTCKCEKYNTTCDAMYLHEQSIANCNHDTVLSAIANRLVQICSR